MHNTPHSAQPQAATPEVDEPLLSVSTSAVPSGTAKTEFSKIPFFYGSLPELSRNTVHSETFRERIVTKTLPRLLANKEGSYTNLSELFRGDGSFSLDLRSNWATRHFILSRKLPDLRVRVIKNPETGEYEPAGGTLVLPGYSLEASYEVNPASEENKATLQWKKSF